MLYHYTVTTQQRFPSTTLRHGYMAAIVFNQPRHMRGPRNKSRFIKDNVTDLEYTDVKEPKVTDKQPLSVKGYSPQSQETIDLVNEGKELEERYLRWLDKLFNQIDPPSDTKPMSYKYDARCLAEARTHIQTGAMWAIRAIFKPQRIKLPEDTQ